MKRLAEDEIANRAARQRTAELDKDLFMFVFRLPAFKEYLFRRDATRLSQYVALNRFDLLEEEIANPIAANWMIWDHPEARTLSYKSDNPALFKYMARTRDPQLPHLTFFQMGQRQLDDICEAGAVTIFKWCVDNRNTIPCVYESRHDWSAIHMFENGVWDSGLAQECAAKANQVEMFKHTLDLIPPCVEALEIALLNKAMDVARFIISLKDWEKTWRGISMQCLMKIGRDIEPCHVMQMALENCSIELTHRRMMKILRCTLEANNLPMAKYVFEQWNPKTTTTDDEFSSLFETAFYTGDLKPVEWVHQTFEGRLSNWLQIVGMFVVGRLICAWPLILLRVDDTVADYADLPTAIITRLAGQNKKLEKDELESILFVLPSICANIPQKMPFTQDQLSKITSRRELDPVTAFLLTWSCCDQWTPKEASLLASQLIENDALDLARQFPFCFKHVDVSDIQKSIIALMVLNYGEPCSESARNPYPMLDFVRENCVSFYISAQTGASMIVYAPDAFECIEWLFKCCFEWDNVTEALIHNHHAVKSFEPILDFILSKTQLDLDPLIMKAIKLNHPRIAGFLYAHK